jgi:hypothetical protein
MKEIVLTPEVAKKYKLADTVSTATMVLPERFGRTEVNFSTMTVAEADAWAAKGLPYLIPVSTGK